MEKCKLSDDEVRLIVTRAVRTSDEDPRTPGACVYDAIHQALRLQRVRFIARIRKEAELFDADLGGDALSNIADLLESDS